MIFDGFRSVFHAFRPPSHSSQPSPALSSSGRVGAALISPEAPGGREIVDHQGIAPAMQAAEAGVHGDAMELDPFLPDRLEEHEGLRLILAHFIWCSYEFLLVYASFS